MLLGVLRRSRLIVPLLAVGAGVLGGAFPDRLVVVLPLVAVIAIVVVVALERVIARRMAGVAEEVGGPLRQRVEALREQRASVERVLDAMPNAVLLFRSGTLAYANPSARVMFDVASGPRLTPLRAMGTPALAQAVQEAAETGRQIDVAVTRNGRELAATASAVAAKEVALIVTDETDVRRVDILRRDFVANASHELKTPVTGMQALSDSLGMAMERDPDRAQRMVKQIQMEATRLAQLVRDLLDLTRLEEDAMARTRQPVDLAAVCKAQVERLRSLAEDRGVTLRCQGERTTVVGIPEDMRLIAANLVRNAIEYNRPGGEVEVSVSREGATARIEVADTGIGIRVADQDRIFERFYRVDKARSRAAGGTGLGLSLVRHAAQRHGGRVRVRSVLGEGSTFTVELPVDGVVSEAP